ncbi:MAG: hypothetical protein RIS35_540, partial [Pseudomonadota bacterium]
MNVERKGRSMATGKDSKSVKGQAKASEGTKTSRARRAAGTASAKASDEGARAAPGAGSGSASTAGSGNASGFPQMPALQIAPERLAQLQTDYFEQWRQLMGTAAAQSAPELKDKRFAGEAWQDKGAFNWTAAMYLLNAQFLQKMADSVEGDRQARERIRFATQQWVDMLSPANFLATNPEAQRKLIETRGESLKVGLEQMISDLQRGQISQTDEQAFEVGKNVATSTGAVVFQNDLIQLIQYTPSTPQVGARPLL